MKCSCGWWELEGRNHHYACSRCGDWVAHFQDGTKAWIPAPAKRAVTEAVSQVKFHFDSIHRDLQVIRQRQYRLMRRPRPKPFQYFPSTMRVTS